MRRFWCDAVRCGRRIFAERFARNREPATAQAWLIEQPQIEIIARGRGGAYARAASKALPHAIQVADRWHLMENASRAFLDAVRRSMRQIRRSVGAMTINPDLLTAAERLQYEGYLRREDTNTAVMAIAKGGVSIKEIVRRTGYSRGLVRRIVRGEHGDVFRVRESSLEGHLPLLEDEWGSGLPQRCRALATSKIEGLPRLASRRDRMGHTSAPGRARRR